MKKAYIYPTLNVVHIEARKGLLFASGEDPVDGGGNLGNFTGGQLGHETDGDWDDEEEY